MLSKKLTPSYALELCVLTRCDAVTAGCDPDFERRVGIRRVFLSKEGEGEGPRGSKEKEPNAPVFC